MVANMRRALDNPPVGHDRAALRESFQPVLETLEGLDQLSHLESRIGNEVMFDMNELMAPPVQQPRPTLADLGFE